ncbi:MAG TPA: hypothetical protein VG755_22940 [Nannocystaceae bacterium]|nr:hypothetical protein [Nannocystaceae bacterium]
MSTRSSLYALWLVGCASSPNAEATTVGEAGSGPNESSSEATESSGAASSSAASSGVAEDDSSSGDASSDGTSTTTSTDDTGSGACDPRASGTIYLSRDYEVEDPEELFVDPVATVSYVEGECWNASNCWQVNPIGTSYNEDHAGWGTDEIPPLEEGGTTSMFVGHLIYMSSGMMEVFENPGIGGKMLDAYMWSPDDDILGTRQTVIWSYWNPEHPSPDFVDTSSQGIVPRLLKGGAGGNYVKQIGEVQFDFRDYPDQWVWMEYEFNSAERYTALWVKTMDGVFDGCAPIMRRSADEPADWVHEYWVEEPYAYAENAGWRNPGLLWGYWDDLEGKPLGEDDYVRLDHVVLSDAWIEPPF